jgi:hypothetical protein
LVQWLGVSVPQREKRRVNDQSHPNAAIQHWQFPSGAKWLPVYFQRRARFSSSLLVDFFSSWRCLISRCSITPRSILSDFQHSLCFEHTTVVPVRSLVQWLTESANLSLESSHSKHFIYSIKMNQIPFIYVNKAVIESTDST